jgi:hypothetical protein
MSTVYLFGDEAGNFDFSDGPGASRYFILATVTMSNCQAGDRLQALRRRLAWQGVHLGAVLHAIPAAMRNPQDLYRHVWHEHFARIAQDIAQPAIGCLRSRPISGPANAEAPSMSRSTTPSVPQPVALTASRSGQT